MVVDILDDSNYRQEVHNKPKKEGDMLCAGTDKHYGFLP